jgi:uncharacterized membrane protein
MPDEVLRHNISDEELTMLADARRDNIWEGMWVALGSTVGFLPSAVSTIYAYIKMENYALPGLDLIQLVLFFVSLTSFLILLFITRNKSRDIKDLVKAIRERTKCLRESTSA